MHFLRRWHGQHAFHHHSGHRHGGPGFDDPDPAGHASRHLAERLAARLDLDEAQQQRLAAGLAQFQAQREAWTALVRGPGLAALFAGDGFDREAARQLFDARLDALRAAGPGLIAALGDFHDALDAEQSQALRFMMRRFGAGRHRGRAA